MRHVLRLALLSLWNRRMTALLTVGSLSISVILLLGVLMLRTAAWRGFANTVSGTDLIVGARSNPLSLLLYSVFHIGDPTANVSWESYRKIARHRDVAWTIPISLGDSHRGFRVIGTNADFFRHFSFGDARRLQFVVGRDVRDVYDAVVGASVADALRYRIGDSIVLTHGLGEASFAEHKDKPFRIVGILARTGTPVDRTVVIGLQGMTAIHLNWRTGMLAPQSARVAPDRVTAADLTPHEVTAFLVGMRSRVMTFAMQRAINEYKAEALTAILPGIALSQLWDLLGAVDAALAVLAAFVVLAGLLGMLIAILTSLNERRREMAILRSVGARPHHVFALLLFEAGVLALSGVVLGTVLAYVALLLGRPLLQGHFGVYIDLEPLTSVEMSVLCAVVLSAVLMGLIPAWRAYRNSLSDGLQIRV